MKFQGVLFFPVTPFTADGSLDEERLAQHIDSGVAAGAGGVFVACGTGEFHALTPGEIERVRSEEDSVAADGIVCLPPRRMSERSPLLEALMPFTDAPRPQSDPPRPDDDVPAIDDVDDVKDVSA